MDAQMAGLLRSADGIGKHWQSPASPDLSLYWKPLPAYSQRLGRT